MIKLIIQSIRQTLVWTVVCGVLYPLAMTAIAQLAFPRPGQRQPRRARRQAGRLGAPGPAVHRRQVFLAAALGRDLRHRPVGHQRRPAAAISGRRAPQLQTNVRNNAKALREAHKLPADAPVPADLVYASASGLDPHISPEAARFQIARVAAARGIERGQGHGRSWRNLSSRRSGVSSARPESTCSC